MPQAVTGTVSAPWDDARRSSASSIGIPAVTEAAAAFAGEAFLEAHPAACLELDIW